jgi:hypothetical protein
MRNAERQIVINSAYTHKVKAMWEDHDADNRTKSESQNEALYIYIYQSLTAE